MKTEVVWSERIPAKDSLANYVYDITFRPDGTQLLIAIGNRILVYEANDGDLLHSLKGHRDYVYAVAYSRDGKRFASGGADKTIIIWTNKCEGILKYSHNDSIQCLAYNPITQQLASATASDFGLWSPEQKSVQKFKVTAKVLAAAWTNDGQYLALGQFNGHISIRDKSGNEKIRIERNSPVWCLTWSPLTSEKIDLLAVGCWDQTLSFYQLSGAQQGKDRNLEYDPCSLCYYGDGEYLLIGGSDRKVSMYTKDGVFLRVVCEREDWVWAIKARPKNKFLAVGCNDGTVAMYQTIFSTVHGLYQDRYAHRDTMTDVIIQHLITEQKVRIKTRDYVKKIAVYKARLAVQLPDRVLIYETVHNEPYDMHYRLKDKLLKKLECNLLVVTSMHIILCQERRLQLYNFKGKKIREWVLEAVIRYIRVVGGPTAREGLLVGLKNGSVFKIFIDNRFPVKLIKHSAPVRCLDLSASRKKLAVVDENSKVYVYDLITEQILFEENNANSVAWNTDIEQMFCYSGNGQLCIKTGDFPVHKQTLQGFVVGFKGSKIFCLHYLSMQTIDVPQSASLYRYLEKKDYHNAYLVACLGVTDTDWRELAISALLGLCFDVARKAFIRIRDVRYIELLNRIEIARKSPQHDDTVFLGDIHAYQGNYAEAARLYVKAGQRKKAIEMYLDLRDWEKAKELVESAQGGEITAAPTEESKEEKGKSSTPSSAMPAMEDSNLSMTELLKRQADWLRAMGDFKGASEMYWACKEYGVAIQIMGDNNWLADLMEKVRQLNKLHRKHIAQAATYFRKANHYQFAKEAYLKMDDIKSLLNLHIEQHKWDEAFALAKQRPEFAKEIYQPYAEWLAINDRFDEAQQAFKEAGREDMSVKMLEQLTTNAITENRYNDAGYYYWLLAQEYLKLLRQSTSKSVTKADKKTIESFQDAYEKAELYYSYHSIYRYTDEPFTSLMPEAIFQISQYILNNTRTIAPFGISKVYCLFALAKQGKQLEAYKLARQAYTKLLQLKMPPSWRDQIDLAWLTIQTKPYNDKEELLPVCYRCSTSNPLLSNSGDKCINCAHQFIRSFCSFEPLPLVEFSLADGISDEEAIKLLEVDPIDKKNKKGKKGDDDGESDTLNLDEGEEKDEDLFQQQLMNLAPNLDGSFPPIKCDKETLISMRREEVYISKWNSPLLPIRYYRSVIPDMPITFCDNCKHFFYEEDFEFHVLQKKACPFCRLPINPFPEEIKVGTVADS